MAKNLPYTLPCEDGYMMEILNVFRNEGLSAVLFGHTELDAKLIGYIGHKKGISIAICDQHERGITITDLKMPEREPLTIQKLTIDDCYVQAPVMMSQAESEKPFWEHHYSKHKKKGRR